MWYPVGALFSMSNLLSKTTDVSSKRSTRCGTLRYVEIRAWNDLRTWNGSLFILAQECILLKFNVNNLKIFVNRVVYCIHITKIKRSASIFEVRCDHTSWAASRQAFDGFSTPIRKTLCFDPTWSSILAAILSSNIYIFRYRYSVARVREKQHF